MLDTIIDSMYRAAIVGMLIVTLSVSCTPTLPEPKIGPLVMTLAMPTSTPIRDATLIPDYDFYGPTTQAGCNVIQKGVRYYGQ